MTTLTSPTPFAVPWRRWPWLVDLSPLLLEIVTIPDLLGSDDHHHAATHAAGVLAWIVAQALLLPLVLRRRHPVGVFIAVSVIGTAQFAVDSFTAASFALLIALYTLAAHRPRALAYRAAALVEVGALIASVQFNPAGDDMVASAVFLTGLVAAALFVGTSMQARRDYLAALEDRARRLERERDQQAEIAATAERTRIAREMHDIVAHSLSVMTTLADGAVAAAATDPEGAREAMTRVGETGRTALGEMRRLLGVLRDQHSVNATPQLAPQPDLQRLDDLLEEMRGAGLPLEYTVTGTPRPLPSTAEATVYRIVQESLTNVLKHAIAPALVRVTLGWSNDGLTIEVTDDGTPMVGALVAGAEEPAGHGLRGIRERAALYDGDVVSGPRRNVPGWRVTARLRIDGGEA